MTRLPTGAGLVLLCNFAVHQVKQPKEAHNLRFKAQELWKDSSKVGQRALSGSSALLLSKFAMVQTCTSEDGKSLLPPCPTTHGLDLNYVSSMVPIPIQADVTHMARNCKGKWHECMCIRFIRICNYISKYCLVQGETQNTSLNEIRWC